MQGRTGLALAAACAACLFAAAPSQAAFDSCTYDAGSETATASLITSHDGSLSVGAGGEIRTGTAPCGDATTSNTDHVVVTGTDVSDTATINFSGPGGAFADPVTGDEIHFDVDLGYADDCDPQFSGCVERPQELRIVGTPGDDDIRAGSGTDGALLVNLDASSDVDPEIRALGPRLDVDGGAGSDAISGWGGSGTGHAPVRAMTVRGGPGDDRLAGGEGTRGFYRYRPATNVFHPGAGDDHVIASPTGTDTLSYEEAPGGVVTDGYETVADDGFGGYDRVQNILRIRGSAHADRLSPIENGAGWYEGGAGDDEIAGSEYDGDELLLGGPGNDRLKAGDLGASRERGDRLVGGGGDDVLIGSSNPDDLEGGLGDDVLEARRGRLVTWHGVFRDVEVDDLYGGPGSDTLIGGRDPDLYVFEPPTGREVDRIGELANGGRDRLVFDYGEDTTPVAIDLSKNWKLGQTGARALRAYEFRSGWNIEDVETGRGDDHITGNRRSNRLLPYWGNDVVHVEGAGRDVVECSGGLHDTIHADRRDRFSDCESFYLR